MYHDQMSADRENGDWGLGTGDWVERPSADYENGDSGLGIRDWTAVRCRLTAYGQAPLGLEGSGAFRRPGSKGAEGSEGGGGAFNL